MAKGATYMIGDVVQLKSGGPKMTVSACNIALTAGDDAKIKCQWFSGTKHQEAWFPEGSLEPAKIDKKP